MKTSKALSPTMRAIVQERYGGPDTLQVATVARPVPGEDQILIRVHAAGVDRGVWHLMTGLPYLVRVLGYGLRRPRRRVPGMDVAGTVVAVGSSVTRFSVGDEVFGISSGSFAEYAVADEAQLAMKPDGVTFEEAAAAGVSGSTAIQALVDIGGLRPGDDVLVVGASGGVGSFAVQLAVAMGATVTGVASGHKAELVRSLGAARVLDHRTDDPFADVERHDLIIDVGGRNPVRRMRKALRRDGTLVIVGGEGGDRWTGGIGRQLGAVLRSPFVRQRLRMFIAEGSHTHLERLAAYLAARSVRTAIGERFALEEVPQALHRLEQGAISGKAVVVVRRDGGR